MKAVDNNLLQEQIAYYQARASEYDEWFLRQGRYDHGPAHTQRWFDEVAEVQTALAQCRPVGQILEFASGTGWWTEKLAPYAEALVAVDASMETIEINKERLQSSKISYVHTDIFAWEPTQKFDLIFFSFWLSHVPTARFEEFWTLVRRCIKPGGRVFFIDSLYHPSSTAIDQSLRGRESTTVQRRLKDGRTFEIVKIFYDRETLIEQLEGLGWKAELKETANHFLYGLVQLESDVKSK